MSQAARPGRPWWITGLRWTLAAAPVFALAAVLIYSGALGALDETLHRVGPATWALALVGQAISYLGRAARLQAADRPRFGGHFGLCLRLILVNNALNLALPLRAGEASFPLLLRRWFGMDLLQGTGTLIWMRLLDLQILAAAALLSLSVLGTASTPGITRLWLAALVLLLMAPLLLWRLRARIRAWLQHRSGPIAKRLLQILAGMPDSGAILIEAWLWTLASWIVKLAMLGILLAALADSSKMIGLLGVIGGDLSTVLPLHSPGGFGSFEAGVVALTAAFQSPTPQLLSAALSYHLFVLGCALAAGLIAWILPGRKSTDAKSLQP